MNTGLQKDVLGNSIIEEFQGEYRFLSNFWRCSLEFEGLHFPSAEHAYQWAKTLEPEEQIAMLRCPTPGAAKTLGDTVTLRPDWKEIRVHIMMQVITEKYGQNPDLAKLLVATDDAILVEGNWWHDNFWGNCYCNKCKDIPGVNVLGNLTMEVRRCNIEYK